MTELEPQNNERVDQAGAVASTLCAIHCAICALLPAAFGALGLGMLLSQTAEWAFTIVAVSIAFGALVLSWRQHRSVAVAGLLSLGIVGLLASRVLEMGSDHHHHGEHHADHHDEVAHTEDAHHDSVAEKHEDHHDEGHDEKHVADAHGHDHDGHSSEKHHDNHKAEHHGEHEEGHEGEGDSHDDDNHTLGASVGVAGGMLLLFGHILNIGTSRKRKVISTEECCD